MAEKKDVTKSVKVSKLVTPNFLTLTGLPANQVAFKIVRKDNAGTKVITRQRTVRRMSPTLVMAFPVTMTEEEVTALMKDYGLDDYKMEKSDQGIMVMRSDMTEPPKNYITVKLKDGVVAMVAQGSVVASDENPLPNISVVGLEFQKDVFDAPEKVQEWLTRNNIDIPEAQIDNAGEETVIVSCLKVEKTVETKRCTVDEGVQAVVVRSVDQSVPPSIVEVVSETAYGGWGWGQLDFAAALADMEFSEVAREGLNILSDLLYEILFYSPLPVDVRKELVNRATAQFAAYIGSLLDALPAKVLLSYRSQKEIDMTTTATKDQATKDAEAKAAATEKTKRADAARVYLKEILPAAEHDALAKKTEDEVLLLEVAARKDAETKAGMAAVTRDDVTAIVTDAIKNSVGPLVTEAIRSIFAPPKVDDKGAAAATETEATVMGKQFGEAMRSSMEPVIKATETMGKAVSDLAERMGKVESATTVRSDGGDSKQTTNKRKDTFAGMFGNKVKADETVA